MRRGGSGEEGFTILRVLPRSSTLYNRDVGNVENAQLMEEALNPRFIHGLIDIRSQDPDLAVAMHVRPIGVVCYEILTSYYTRINDTLASRLTNAPLSRINGEVIR